MITADELRELKDRSGGHLCTDYWIDILRRLKEETGAQRVNLSIGDFGRGYDIELSIFIGDRVYPFLVDRYDIDAGQWLIRYAKKHIVDQESEPES